MTSSLFAAIGHFREAGLLMDSVLLAEDNSLKRLWIVGEKNPTEACFH